MIKYRALWQATRESLHINFAILIESVYMCACVYVCVYVSIHYISHTEI